MRVNKRFVVTAATALTGACLAVAALAPASSAATKTYSVTPGGTVKAVNSGSLTFEDSTSSSHPKLVCTKFASGGSAAKGAHAFAPATYPGKTTGISAAGTLSKPALTGCTNAIVGNVTVTPSGTWYLAATADTSTGVTGYLYNVSAKVSAAGCVFNSTGAVYGTYTNKTGVFAGTSKTSGLVISSVSGATCGLVGVKNGDKAYLAGSVKLSPIQILK